MESLARHRPHVRQSGKLLQKGFCFVHTLRHGEGLTVGGGPNGRAKKGEGATGVDLNPFWENPHVDTTVGPPTGGDFALAWVELESNLASSGGEAGKRCSSVTVVTAKHTSSRKASARSGGVSPALAACRAG